MKIKIIQRKFTGKIVLEFKAEKLFHLEKNERGADPKNQLDGHLEYMIREVIKAMEDNCGRHIQITSMNIEGNFEGEKKENGQEKG